MKKLLVTIAAVTAMFLLCSCATTDINKKSIAVISAHGEVLDNNYNQLVWEGVCLHSNKADISFRSSQNPTEFTANLNALVDKKTNVILCSDGSANNTIYESAAENPSIMFACVDASFENALPNLTGISFRGNEGAFVAGYIAARTSVSKKVGFIGGENVAVINEFEHGFTQGVKYANPKIEVLVDYAGSYTDEGQGTALAKSQYEQGADIIFQAAGLTGLGVISQAKAMNKFVIGVDTDQSTLAPQNVLTSVVKNTNTVVGEVIGKYLAGEDIGGKNFEFGLSDGGIDIADNNGLISGQVYNEAMLVKSQIIDGTIIVLR